MPLRSSPKSREESIKIEGVSAIFRLVNVWCGLARWPNKGEKKPGLMPNFCEKRRIFPKIGGEVKKRMRISDQKTV